MTTTANLSVGINTGAAKEALKELKQAMAGSMNTLAVSIDPNSIDRQIAGFFKQRTFKFKTDVASFKEIAAEIENELGVGVNRAFSKNRELRWNFAQFDASLGAAFKRSFDFKDRKVLFDSTGLTRSLELAIQGAFAVPKHVSINTDGVKEQLAGLKVGVSATMPVPPRAALSQAPAAAFDQRMGESMTTMVRSILVGPLDELAKAVATLGASARKVGGGMGAGGAASASKSIASTGPDGFRTTYREKLENPADALTGIQSATALEKASQAHSRRRNFENNLDLADVRQAERRAEADRKAAELAASEVGPNRETLLGLRDQSSSRARQFYMRRRNFENNLDLADVRQAERRAEADRKAAELAASEVGPNRETLLKLRDQASTVAAQAAKAAQAAQVQNLIRSTKAAASDQYTSKGQALLAYQAVKENFGGNTADATFNSRWLAENLGNLEKYRVKVKETADDVARNMRSAMQTVYNTAKWTAAGQTNSDGSAKFTARGTQVAGATALIGKYGQTDGGMAQVKGFLNNDALVAEASLIASGAKGLDAYHAAIKKASVAGNEHTQINKAMSQSLGEVHSSVRGLAGGLGMLWATWGSTVPLLAGAAIAAGLKGVYDEGKRVEYQLAFIKGLSGTTLNQKDIESSVAGSLFGVKDALDGLRSLTQSGLTAKEAVAALPDVLQLATVGEVSVGDAAFAATGVLKAFGLSINEVGRVSDVMAKASAMSNASVQDMMQAFKYASASSALYGVSLEETGAALAMLSEKNIKGSMAGTAHMNLLREIYTPTGNAAKAFKVLGLNMEEMQRKGMSSVDMLDAIRTKTAALDSTGLRAFTAVIGGERGSRELAPLLEGGTKKLKDVENQLNESKGFTQAVMLQLQDTVEASSARMRQSLTMAFSGAFEDSKGQVQRFNDTLATAFRSEGFRSSVESMASAVVNLTRFMSDHASTLLLVVEAYAALKVVQIVSGIMSGLTAQVFMLSGAMTAQAAATATAATAIGWLSRAMGLLSSSFGIISLVVGAAVVAYQMLTSRTDEAREAQDRYNNRTANTLNLLDEEIKRLKMKRELIENPGKSEAQVTVKTETDRLRNHIESVEAADRFLKQESAKGSSGIREVGVLMADGSSQRMDQYAVMQAMKQVAKEREDLSVRMKKSAEVDAESAALDASTARASMQTWLAQAKDGLRARMELTKDPKKLANMSSALNSLSKYESEEGLSGIYSAKQAEQVQKRLMPFKDTEGSGFTMPKTGKVDRQPEKDAFAALAEKEAQYNRETALLDSSYKTQEAILKARESAKLITLGEFETRQDELARNHLQGRQDLAATMLRDVKSFADANPLFKDDKKARLDTWIENAKNKVRLVEDDAREAIGKADAAVQGKLKAIAEAGADARIESVLRDMKMLRELSKTSQELDLGLIQGAGPAAQQSMFPKEYVNNLSTSGLSDASRVAVNAERENQRRDNYEARMAKKFSETTLRGAGAKDTSVKAAMAAYDGYESKIVQFTKDAEAVGRDLERLVGERDALVARMVDPSASVQMIDRLTDKVATLNGDIAKATKNSELVKANLSEQDKLRNQSAEAMGAAAGKVYEQQRTPEYGMISFWKSYVREAGDAAKLVNNVMGQSFSSIEAGLLQFATTGKLHFKSFASSVIADAARMMAANGIKQLLSMGLNFVMSAMGGGSNNYTGAGNTGSGIGNAGAGDYASLTTSANGNIMTSAGPLALQKYANGGIARTPQLSLFGEGKLPEAYVPLPDGRTIPVTMSGGGGGAIQVSSTINIASDGKSQVESDVSGEKAAQLQQMVDQAVVSIIQREKRHGGILSA